MGFRGPTLAIVGYRGPALAYVGCRGLLWPALTRRHTLSRLNRI